MRISMNVLGACALIVFGTGSHAVAQSADNIKACVGPSGAMRMVAPGVPCKANESAVEWSASGSAPVPAPAPAPGGAGLRVVNASGEDLGPLLGSSTAVLTLPSGRKTYAELFPLGPPANWTIFQYYTTTDCSGEPLIVWSLEELVPAAFVRRSGVWATRPGTIALRALKSGRGYDDNGPSASCSPVNSSAVTMTFDFFTPQTLKLVYPLTVQ
jgi:hypothetical protein